VSDAAPTAAVFDLGGVVIDWNPRHLYRKLFPADTAAMEAFLRDVCSPAWNARQDAGRSWAEAVESLTREHPDLADLIRAYDERWSEMLGDAIEGTVEIIGELKRANFPVYALSNWSAEKFPIALTRYDVLGWFDGVVISGAVGIAKPDDGIFRHLLDRYALDPRATVFVDDTRANLVAAKRLGLIGVPFVDPARLRADLRALQLPIG
jgi:2-haloacid dehalogenase